jgi:hypothetical protein
LSEKEKFKINTQYDINLFTKHLKMKAIIFITLCFLVVLQNDFSFAQVVERQAVTVPVVVKERPDLRIIEKPLTPEFKVTINTWSAGKISASQAVISYSIRIDDTTQPMEHGVCYSTSTNPSVSNPKTVAKGYTTNTLYGTLSGLKPGMKYYVKAYMKLLNYPDKIYYGNEISFTTLQETTK